MTTGVKTPISLVCSVSPALVCAVASLTLLEIPLWSAAIIVVVVVSIVWLGQIVALRCGLGNISAGAGFVVGVGLFVFTDQVLLLTGFPPAVAHWTVFLLLTGLSIWLRSSTISTSQSHEVAMANSTFFALVITLFAVSIRQNWLFPFALTLVALERLWWLKPGKSAYVLAVGACLPAAWWWSRILRPDRWWYFYQGNDSQFFESISWSTSQWGVFEHPGYIGGSIAPYHWFSYSLLGLLSHLGSLAPWDGLTKFGAPLVTFLIICVIFPDSKPQQKNLGAPVWLIALVLAVLLPVSQFDSLLFSILIALGLSVLANKCVSLKMSASLIGLFVLVSMTLVFSKVSTAGVMLVYLFSLATTQALRQKRVSWIPPVILLLTLIISYGLLFRAVPTSGTFVISPNLEATVGELRNLLDTPSLFSHVLVWCLPLVALKTSMQKLESHTIVLLILVPAGLAFHLIQARGTSAYFSVPLLYLLTVVAARSWIQHNTKDAIAVNRRQWLGAVVVINVGVIIGFMYRAGLSRVESQFEPPRFVGDLLWSTVKGSGYVLLCLGTLWLARLQNQKSRLKSVLLVSAFFVALSVGLGIDSYRQVITSGADSYTNWQGNSAPFANQDLIRVGQFVRSSTDPNVVLASNNFCCAGQQWWEQTVQDLDGYTKSVFGEDKWGGANYLLPAETRRRFLIGGLRFQTGYAPATPEQVRRMSLSLEFANAPTPSVVTELKAYGVRGYVVNLQLTDNRNWKKFASEKFRSGDFIYLELK